MTKEITKAIILQEMRDKLHLREFDPAKFLFDETVVPVYDIGQHLKHYKNKFEEVSVTAATAIKMFEVPASEKWTLYRYDIVFMGAGAYKVSGALTMRFPIVSGETCYLDLTAAQTVSYHVQLPVPVVLMPGDRIYVNVDDYTSTQNLRLYIDYEMEEIR